VRQACLHCLMLRLEVANRRLVSRLDVADHVRQLQLLD
jgi:hypothetical protein